MGNNNDLKTSNQFSRNILYMPKSVLLYVYWYFIFANSYLFYPFAAFWFPCSFGAQKIILGGKYSKLCVNLFLLRSQ